MTYEISFRYKISKKILYITSKIVNYLLIKVSDKFTFIGDEVCSKTTEQYVKNSTWLFADAYMAGEEAEKYK